MEWSMEYGTKLMSVKLGLQNAVVINDPYRARELFGDFNFSGRPQCYFTQVLSGGCHGEISKKKYTVAFFKYEIIMG